MVRAQTHLPLTEWQRRVRLSVQIEYRQPAGAPVFGCGMDARDEKQWHEQKLFPAKVTYLTISH